MKQTLDVTARKETLEESASRELNSSYAIVVNGELAYQHAAMLNMFRKGAEWQAKQSPWISVKDRLPEPEQDVFLYDRGSIRHYVVGWLRKKKGYNDSIWCITNGYLIDETITHWMPIPNPEL